LKEAEGVNQYFFGIAGSQGTISADTEQQKTTETLLENFDVDLDDD